MAILKLTATAVLTAALALEMYTNRKKRKEDRDGIVKWPDGAMVNYMTQGYKSPQRGLLSLLTEMQGQGILNEKFQGIRRPFSHREQMVYDTIGATGLSAKAFFPEDGEDLFWKEWYESVIEDLVSEDLLGEKNFDGNLFFRRSLPGLVAIVLSLILFRGNYPPALVPFFLGFIRIFVAFLMMGALPPSGKRSMIEWEKAANDPNHKYHESYAIATGKNLNKKQKEIEALLLKTFFKDGFHPQK